MINMMITIIQFMKIKILMMTIMTIMIMFTMTRMKGRHLCGQLMDCTARYSPHQPSVGVYKDGYCGDKIIVLDEDDRNYILIQYATTYCASHSNCPESLYTLNLYERSSTARGGWGS